MDADFDPDDAATPESGLFGLPHGPAEAEVHVVPVPFDATTSYRKGTACAPQAILAASHQVELFDLHAGQPYEAGITLLEADPAIEGLNREACELARGVLAVAGHISGDEFLQRDLARVNTIGAEVNQSVRSSVDGILEAGKLPGVLGGDHSVAFGAIAACAERSRGLGILHFDAHADLREAYEGFVWSHASIMHNVLRWIDGIERVVQVGVRDMGRSEYAAIQDSGGRVHALSDRQWAEARFEGRELPALVHETIALLPDEVYVSFDIDGLDPALCPNTGTPVPGGLSWQEANLWLEQLAASGRRVVGFDLTEVNPGDGDPGSSWDAIVGARLLYRLIGTALSSR